jgi:hypothetical protein
LELIKNEDLKKYLSKMLQLESSSNATNSINLQDEKPEVILGPSIKDRDESNHPHLSILH